MYIFQSENAKILQVLSIRTFSSQCNRALTFENLCEVVRQEGIQNLVFRAPGIRRGSTHSRLGAAGPSFPRVDALFLCLHHLLLLHFRRAVAALPVTELHQILAPAHDDVLRGHGVALSARRAAG